MSQQIFNGCLSTLCSRWWHLEVPFLINVSTNKISYSSILDTISLWTFMRITREYLHLRTWDNSVCTAGLDIQGIPGKGKKFFSSPQYPPSLQTNGFHRILPEVEQSVKLTLTYIYVYA
jgi:hypothetical protein